MAVKKHISQPGDGCVVNVGPSAVLHKDSTIFFCPFAVITNGSKTKTEFWKGLE
jgi:hypothetical protein